MSPEYFNDVELSISDLVGVDAYALGVTIYKMIFDSYFIDKKSKISLNQRKKLIIQAVKTVANTD